MCSYPVYAVFGSGFLESGFGSNPDLGFLRQEIEKIHCRNFFSFKNCLSPGLRKRRSKLPEKPSALKREHPALHNSKFLTFFFLFCGSVCILDPDPLT